MFIIFLVYKNCLASCRWPLSLTRGMMNHKEMRLTIILGTPFRFRIHDCIYIYMCDVFLVLLTAYKPPESWGLYQLM